MTTGHFHFLYPLWLLALIPAFLLLWGLWRRQTTQGNWSEVIDAKFHAVLLPDQVVKQTQYLPFLGLGLLWLLVIMALAGPTWQKIKIPANETQTGSVVLLDLSLSMLSEDLKPNRLINARIHLLDLLEQHPEIPIGLVAYAGSAHTLVPISKDNATLKALLPHLHPFIMPRYGSDPIQAFQKAIQLLEGAQVKQGHILWITDDLDAAQIAPLKKLIKQHSLSLSILVMGTEKGAPIPIPQQGLLTDAQDQTVLAKVPVQRFKDFAQAVQASLIFADPSPAATASILDALLPSQFASASSQKNATDKEDKALVQWQNMGSYLLWLVIPLFALGFRRGWLSR